jgi:hypothetical protein
MGQSFGPGGSFGTMAASAYNPHIAAYTMDPMPVGGTPEPSYAHNEAPVAGHAGYSGYSRGVQHGAGKRVELPASRRRRAGTVTVVVDLAACQCLDTFDLAQ